MYIWLKLLQNNGFLTYSNERELSGSEKRERSSGGGRGGLRCLFFFFFSHQTAWVSFEYNKLVAWEGFVSHLFFWGGGGFFFLFPFWNTKPSTYPSPPPNSLFGVGLALFLFHVAFAYSVFHCSRFVALSYALVVGFVTIAFWGGRGILDMGWIWVGFVLVRWGVVPQLKKKHNATKTLFLGQSSNTRILVTPVSAHVGL